MTNVIKHQSMRIAGKKVDAEKNINVHYPYTNEIIGTVPAGTAEHAKQALEIATNYQPKLTLEMLPLIWPIYSQTDMPLLSCPDLKYQHIQF